jgi:Predicted membrane protein involved in D-alanine export
MSENLNSRWHFLFLTGLWHGANWTFVAWGILNAVYFLPLVLIKKNRRYKQESIALNSSKEKGRLLPSLLEILQMGITFFITFNCVGIL